MISIKKDSKSDTYILTQTDSEGFHKQMHLTWKDLVDIETFIAHVNLENRLKQIYKRTITKTAFN